MATQDHSIIPVSSRNVSGNQEQGVNARDLYNFLEVGRDFSNWIKGRIEEYGFVENQDFGIFAKMGVNSSTRGRKAVDYFLTLEMAKELAMVEKNDKGREARRYFIECERRAKQPRVDPEFIMIHKSVLDNTGKALVWMGDYGVSSQPFYGSGAGQPPFIDGRPVMAIGDSSTRYYLTKYVGNVMESQTIATEECLTRHIRAQFPEVDVIVKEDMRHNLMSLATQLTTLSGQFITSAEINKGLGKAMATRA
ncbi:MAG: hypothetical protein BWK73_19085 [Thiothrix lacustris]|uniref:AntA/AntB antirepressor domain-containing protein n=1 Tax=Thiothrix lacustris TaxID=525917 RepID=A0A1Y1QPM4_9GAMM|nr:MAG: hypothetical protein BWK73_19085 [Thiothrix lacustris]